jgi:hypothetical protein
MAIAPDQYIGGIEKRSRDGIESRQPVFTNSYN